MQKYKIYEGHPFFKKCARFKLHFENAEKNWEKVFYFCSNCISIDIINISLFETGYLSSRANVLKSSLKIWRANKSNFFQLNCLDSDQEIWLNNCDGDFGRTMARLPCRLLMCPMKQDFLDIYLVTFPESVIWEIQNLWGWYFSSKCLRFNSDLKNAE